MIKAIATTIALCLGSMSYAGSFDPAVMDPVVTPPASACYPVVSKRTGEVLYWTGNPANGNCVTAVIDRQDNQPMSNPSEPTCGHKDKDKDNKGKDKDKGGETKGNASANNGKGGNYDKTGHSDNGKGNGKGRR